MKEPLKGDYEISEKGVEGADRVITGYDTYANGFSANGDRKKFQIVAEHGDLRAGRGRRRSTGGVWEVVPWSHQRTSWGLSLGGP